MPITDRMRLWLSCALGVPLALWFLAVPVRATSYLPVTFNDLVKQADVIFVGDVVDVRPFTLRSRNSLIVKTRVTFDVSDRLYGTTSIVEVFDFLGGEADGIGMAVAGMPTFHVGDRRVVFAHRGASVNPIVGFTQGLLQVRRDSNGVDRVLTLEGAPLTRPESIGLSPRMSLDMNASMRLSDFRTRVAGALAAERKQ
jgi:hypothetical protein